VISNRIGLRKICGLYGYSRQAYYKRKEIMIRRQNEKEKVLKEVMEIRARQPRLGTRKLHKKLKEKGIEIGRDRFYAILREEGLLIKRKKKYMHTTNSKHWLKKYSNLIKDKLVIAKDQVFVSDITYIDTYEGYYYLSLITDLYSRKIVGYELSDSLSVEGSLQALKMALKRVEVPEKLIHHSDRGIQYCSKAYVDLLTRHGVRISMTEENHVYENAVAERVNGILKDEFMLGEKLVSYKVAKKMVKEAVEIYNQERPHMSIDYLTPELKYAA
jgi:transposase InsO family protein